MATVAWVGRVVDGTVASVLIHIEGHLNERLDPVGLARAGGLSLPHLRARLRGELGEPLARHVRRLRLERAKLALAYTSQPISEIAVACGFRSHEGFTRAFHRAYALAPLDFRTAVGRTLGSAARRRSRVAPRVRVERRPTLRVAFVRHVGPYDEAWNARQRLVEHVRAAGIALPDVQMVGIRHASDSIADPVHRRYDAGVEVGRGYVGGRDLAVQVLPGGVDAVLAYRGGLAGLEDLWTWVTEGWLAETVGCACRDDRIFEVHRTPIALGPGPDAIVRTVRAEFDVELHIPVSRRHFVANGWPPTGVSTPTRAPRSIRTVKRGRMP